jgi:DNA polymerase (family 10)
MIAAERIVDVIKQLPETKNIEVAGSLRRCKETVKDIDILAASDNPMPIMNKFVSLDGIAQVNAKGETKSSVILEEGISVDLRVVSPKQFPSALNYFTGSKEHNVALRSRAIKMGMKLSEYGLFKIDKDKETLIENKSEEEIYKTLELSYIPPELREDRGEIEAAEKDMIPKLVEYKDILGTFHIHSDYSDGAMTIKTAVDTAMEYGLKYIGIADHSQSAFYAKGLKPDNVKRQWEEIDSINEKLKGFKIFKGIESDILKDGSLDYNEEILKGFDFIVGSVHSNFNMSEADMTKRILKALENPYLTMLGHPTGRLLLARDGYPIDLDAVIDSAAKHKVIIEINSNPYRLDLDWRFCKKAIDKGIMLSINPDAHNKDGFSHIRFGVGVARKGWCEKKDILNTRTKNEIDKIFKEYKKS